MKVFKCACSWSFVVGKRKVYGPVDSGVTPLMMSLAEFSDSHRDCEYRYNVTSSPPPETIIDGDGDTWGLRSEVYYLTRFRGEPVSGVTSPRTRKDIRATFGIKREC